LLFNVDGTHNYRNAPVRCNLGLWWWNIHTADFSSLWER